MAGKIYRKMIESKLKDRHVERYIDAKKGSKIERYIYIDRYI